MGSGDEVLRIDGGQPVSADLVAAVTLACDRAEGDEGTGRLILEVSGAPAADWLDGQTVGLVSKWERVLRRLERLSAVTIAVAGGDCGGAALDALLVADHRIATPSVRLVVPTAAGAAWPNMAVYRLVNQGVYSAAIRRAILFGRPVTAQEAAALHLVDQVTDNVVGALAEVVELSARLSGPGVAVVRRLMLDAATADFEEALGAHLAACDRALRQTAAEVPA